jgi:hypothetical protein
MNSVDRQATSGQSRLRPAFSQVGVLLSRHDLWGEWLAKHPDRAGLFKEVFSCVVRLESHTGWSVDEVLDRLGCDTKTEEELEDLTSQRLKSCIDYMVWIEGLLSKLDMAVDKRLALNGAARLFAAADEDLELVEKTMDAGDFSPSEYLRLGETAPAWKAAFRLLPGVAGERARSVHDENPFVDEATPHMTPMRLEMLSSPNATELLGERTAAHMREHLENCPACAAAQRRAELAENRVTNVPG